MIFLISYIISNQLLSLSPRGAHADITFEIHATNGLGVGCIWYWHCEVKEGLLDHCMKTKNAL